MKTVDTWLNVVIASCMEISDAAMGEYALQFVSDDTGTASFILSPTTDLINASLENCKYSLSTYSPILVPCLNHMFRIFFSNLELLIMFIRAYLCCNLLRVFFVVSHFSLNRNRLCPKAEMTMKLAFLLVLHSTVSFFNPEIRFVPLRAAFTPSSRKLRSSPYLPWKWTIWPPPYRHTSYSLCFVSALLP